VVKLTLPDGKPIDPAGVYLVATNDFMAQGGDGFDVFAKGKDLRVTDDLVRNALMADCESRGRSGAKLDIKLDGRYQDAAGAPATPANSKP
jgi:2',3'-cyclic-nucleotide 2'-phosphodiesterase (5'-nucleotidase family)